jgi:hypothetical protein
MRKRWLIAGLVAVVGAGVALAQVPTGPDEFEQRSGEQLLRREIDETAERVRSQRAEERTSAARKPAAADETQEAKIVNGALTLRHASAGALLKIDAQGRLGGWCTGTMIGCNTFVTAQHCIEDDKDPTHYRVFLQHGGILKVATIAPAPGYDFPTADVAVLKLADTVQGVAPTPVLRTAPAPGSQGIIVGFGRSGGGNRDYGLKRVGGVTTAKCETNFDNTKLICWNYTDPIGAPGQRSNTCNGDSGGPLFVAGPDGRPALAGVTSGGQVRSCLQGDHSYDVNVPLYSEWILRQAGSDANNRACGAGPQALGPGSRVQGDWGVLSAATPSKTFVKPIRGTAKLVRVGLHGVYDQTADFGWTVTLKRSDSRPGPAPCRPDPGQFAFCEFANPGAGQVEITAARRAGNGEFQVVVTEFD